MKWIYEFLESIFGVRKTNIISKLHTGWPDRILADIKRSITQTINNYGYDEIYIGRSSNPKRRIKQHLKSKGHFQKAIIVYETSSLAHAQKVEQALIEHYSSLGTVKVLNKATDSRGSEGEPPYYVYVVLR